MTDLRKAAQALVARWDTPLWKDAPHTGQYIDALRAALAQPEQEPVAWLYESKAGNRTFHLVSDDKRAFHADMEAAEEYPEEHQMTPLYTAPPQRKPLSKDAIREIFLAHGFTVKPGCDDLKSYVYDAARAIEKAHGIGEKT